MPFPVTSPCTLGSSHVISTLGTGSIVQPHANFHYRLWDSGLFQVEKSSFSFSLKKYIQYILIPVSYLPNPPQICTHSIPCCSLLSPSPSLSLNYTVKLQNQKTKYTNKRAFTLATFHSLFMWCSGCRSVSQEQIFSLSITLCSDFPMLTLHVLWCETAMARTSQD